jgi:hypothetical protein
MVEPGGAPAEDHRRGRRLGPLVRVAERVPEPPYRDHRYEHRNSALLYLAAKGIRWRLRPGFADRLRRSRPTDRRATRASRGSQPPDRRERRTTQPDLTVGPASSAAGSDSTNTASTSQTARPTRARSSGSNYDQPGAGTTRAREQPRGTSQLGGPRCVDHDDSGLALGLRPITWRLWSEHSHTTRPDPPHSIPIPSLPLLLS